MLGVPVTVMITCYFVCFLLNITVTYVKVYILTNFFYKKYLLCLFRK